MRSGTCSLSGGCLLKGVGSEKLKADKLGMSTNVPNKGGEGILRNPDPRKVAATILFTSNLRPRLRKGKQPLFFFF